MLTSRNEHCTSSNGPGGSHRQQNTSTRAHVKTSPCVLTSPIGGLEKAFGAGHVINTRRTLFRGRLPSSYLRRCECGTTQSPRAAVRFIMRRARRGPSPSPWTSGWHGCSSWWPTSSSGFSARGITACGSSLTSTSTCPDHRQAGSSSSVCWTGLTTTVSTWQASRRPG